MDTFGHKRCRCEVLIGGPADDLGLHLIRPWSVDIALGRAGFGMGYPDAAVVSCPPERPCDQVNLQHMGRDEGMGYALANQ